MLDNFESTKGTRKGTADLKRVPAGKGRMSFCWITVCFPRQNGKKSKAHVECGTYPLSWSVSSVFHEGRMVYYLLLVAHFFLLVTHERLNV